MVNLAEPDGSFVAVAAAGSEQLRREMIGVRGTAENYRDLVGRAVRWDGLYFVDHRQGVPESLYTFVPDLPDPIGPDGWHPLDCLLAPMQTAAGEWLGVLSVDMPVSRRLPGPQQREILALFAEHASIAIVHARMHTALERTQAQMRYAATHDALTGLANRAFLRGRVDELRMRPGGQLGVLVVDLDGFKGSTTRPGTRPVTRCCGWSPTGCGGSCGRPTSWSGWAATSSWPCCPATTSAGCCRTWRTGCGT